MVSVGGKNRGRRPTPSGTSFKEKWKQEAREVEELRRKVETSKEAREGERSGLREAVTDRGGVLKRSSRNVQGERDKLPFNED